MAKSTLANQLKKIVKQLQGFDLQQPPAPERVPMRMVVEAVLLEGGTAEDVAGTLELFEREFVDYNELRVIEPRILADMLSEDHPSLIDRIEPMLQALNQVVADRHQMNLDHLVGLSRDNAQQGLERYDSLSENARAYIMLLGLGHNVVAVTAPAARSLVALGLFDEGTPADQMQKKIDRVLARSDVYALCKGLTLYGDKLTAGSGKGKSKKTAKTPSTKKTASAPSEKKTTAKKTAKKTTKKKTVKKSTSGKTATKKAKKK